MFQIAIIMNNTTANVSLSYKEKDTALAVYNDLAKGVVRVEDDFGFIISVDPSVVSYILFIDVERSEWVTFERQYAQNRANEAITKKLQELGFVAKLANQQQPQRSRIIQ